MKKYSFQSKMPVSTDLKIKFRLFKVYLDNHRTLAAGLVLAPAAFAMYVLVITPTTSTPEIDVFALTQTVQAAQLEELERAEDGIYHVVREVREGVDKPQYVATVLGENEVLPARVDRVETFQHNETALTLIESNGTNRSFEAFLSREHEDGVVALHHYGPVDGEVEDGRDIYDQAHDLGSLYESYTTLETPIVPVLPVDAQFVSLDESAQTAMFETKVSDTISVMSIIDLATNQTKEDIIYVTEAGTTYEMSRVVYLERSLVPAEEFESVFAADTYDYELIST